MTATAERTRLEALREKQVELASERDAVMIRLEGYPAAIAAEREHSWYSNQKNRPLAQLNSKLSKLIAADAKDAAALAGLNADLSAVRNLIVQEDIKVREAETAEARSQLELLHKQEEGVYQRAGELFASLADVWNDLVEVIESEDQFVQANKLEGGGLAVEPTPASFKAFLLLLHSAATDADVRSAPHTEEVVDSGIYGLRDENGRDIGGAIYDTRVVGTRTVDTRRRLDERDVLYRVF